MSLHASSVRRKRIKKIKQMTMVRQFQACETIVQTATVKGDEDILRVTGAVNNDLVAAEARYIVIHILIGMFNSNPMIPQY